MGVDGRMGHSRLHARPPKECHTLLYKDTPAEVALVRSVAPALKTEHDPFGVARGAAVYLAGTRHFQHSHLTKTQNSYDQPFHRI